MDLNDKIRRDLSRVMGMGEEAREEGNAECDRLEALGWKWISELNQHADPDIARNKKAYDISQAISILGCLLYTSPSPRDRTRSRMPSSA